MRVRSKLLPLGKVYLYGHQETEITQEFLEKLVANFKAGYPHYKPFVNLNHESHEKYGEVVELEIADDGLYVTLELNEDGAMLYTSKKYEYLSAEIDLNYRDRNTGEEVGPVLIGVALTNRPAMPIPPIQKLADMWRTFAKFFADVFRDNTYYAEIEFDYDEDSPWDWDWARDADAIIEKFGWRGLAKACLWYDKDAEKGPSGYPEAKKYYKLPVAKARGNKLVIHWRGVVAARVRLDSTDIPQEDKQEVLEKIKALYKKFNREFDTEIGGETVVNLEEKEQQIQKLSEQLAEKDKRIAELEEELSKYKQQIALNEAEKLKSELVSKGVIPVVAEKFVAKYMEGKFTKEEVLELAESMKIEATRQIVQSAEVSTNDIVQQIAKAKGWI